MRLLLIVAVCISSSCYGFEFDEKLINPFTREVYYRYYLIKRCEEPTQLLHTNTAVWRHINFNKLSTDYIENAVIKEKIQAIKKSHTIDPFLDLWHQMNTHRHIDDPAFHKDFIKLLFMFYKSLEKPAHHKKDPLPDTEALPFMPPLFSIEEMLGIIDKNIDSMHQHQKPKKTSGHRFFDHKQVTTDDIALNYYLIQRLDKAMRLLTMIRDPFPSTQRKNSVDFNNCDAGVNFSHERVNQCFNQILIKKNLEPLAHMWQELIRFRHAGDSHFLKEMLMMLFTVYKDLLLVKLSHESEQLITTEMSTILDLYEHIDELPLDEILHAIDLTTDKLMFLQNMEKKNKKEWIQEYPIVFHTLLALPIAYLIVKTCAL